MDWLIVVLLSMTPALLLGPPAALMFGVAKDLDRTTLVAVVAAASFAEGAGVAFLGGPVTRAGWLKDRLERFRTPRAVAIADRYGVWGGMTIGVATLGQEPILLGLRFLGVPLRRLWLPLALSNVAMALLYDALVRSGAAELSSLVSLWNELYP